MKNLSLTSISGKSKLAVHMTVSTLLNKTIIDTLEQNKAINIVHLDVRELTDIMDGMIICTASSTRHAKSLSDKVLEATRNIKARPLGTEGQGPAEWILLDFCDVVVHIMLETTREFYDLEKLWTTTVQLREQKTG